jgi:hypothetical protein
MLFKNIVKALLPYYVHSIAPFGAVVNRLIPAFLYINGTLSRRRVGLSKVAVRLAQGLHYDDLRRGLGNHTGLLTLFQHMISDHTYDHCAQHRTIIGLCGCDHCGYCQGCY